MAFFTSTFLNNRRAEILRAISRVQYQRNNSSWADAEINSKEVSGVNVIVFANIPSSGAADSITGVRVYDNNGALAGSQSIRIDRSGVNSALVRFTFPLIEET